MSLFDTAGQYQSQTIQRPTGLIAALVGALRRSREDDSIEVVEDANELKHRRREEGYLRDVGMEIGF